MKKFKLKVIFQQESEFEVEAKDEQEILRIVQELGPLTNVASIGCVRLARVKKGEMNRIVKEIS